jgi:hypothetical protein
MTADELYAELERVGRDIKTTQNKLEMWKHSDYAGLILERLAAFEAEERELLERLAEVAA